MSNNQYNEYDPYNQYEQYNPYSQNNSRKKSGKKAILAFVIFMAVLFYSAAIAAVVLLVIPKVKYKQLSECVVAENNEDNADVKVTPADEPYPEEPAPNDADDKEPEEPEPAKEEQEDVPSNLPEAPAETAITAPAVDPATIIEDVWDENWENQVIYSEENTPTYKWAAHATSLYAYLEFGYPDVLTGTFITESDIPNAKKFLDDAWGISDRDSATSTIERVGTSGHRTKFRDFIESDDLTAKVIDACLEDFGSQITLEDTDKITEEYLESKGVSSKDLYKVKGAACAYLRFGDKGLDGYDYLRLIRVSYYCFKCGYISQKEYMSLVSIFNDALQEEYSCFKDIHETYYYGEMFRVAKKDDANDEKLHNIRDMIGKIEKDGYYAEIDKDFDLVDTHDDPYYQMTEKADAETNAYESEIELSDNLEDYTFEINGRVYQLPLSYDEIVDGGFTPDTDADYMVPAGEDFYFKGDYLDNEYSTMDFAVYNGADHPVRLADIPIIYINGNQFRWNQYKKYPYKIAGGFCIEDFTLEDVEKKFGPTTVPEESMTDALGTTLYYYEYQFDSGWYRFLIQPSGSIAGIRMCRYLD